MTLSARLTLTNPPTGRDFSHLVKLINTDHVSPSAADTNPDLSRDRFPRHTMAQFQSGTRATSRHAVRC